jgi:hypothetical protein
MALDGQVVIGGIKIKPCRVGVACLFEGWMMLGAWESVCDARSARLFGPGARNRPIQFSSGVNRKAQRARM